MINLILAVLCSAGVSIFMRASETYCRGKYGILLMNYAVCVIAGLLTTGKNLGHVGENGTMTAVGFGVAPACFTADRSFSCSGTCGKTA